MIKKISMFFIIFVIGFMYVSRFDTNESKADIALKALESGGRTNHYVSPYISYQNENIPVSNGSLTYFKAKFTEPIYWPLTNEICFKLNIKDNEFYDYYYYLVTRDKGSRSPNKMTTFSITTNNFSTYSCLDYSIGQEVFIAKASIYSSSYVELEPMACLSATDSMSSSRNDLEYHRLQNNNDKDSLDKNEIPSFNLNFEAGDPNRVLKKLVIELYYEPFDIVYDKLEFDITEDMYVDDKLRIDDIIIENLSPRTQYHIFYYLSGNDGVEDFYGVRCGGRTHRTLDYPLSNLQIEVIPGFWGIVKDYEIGDSTTRFNITFFNDGTIDANGELATASLNIYNSDDELIVSYPLTDGMTYVDIDNQYLDVSYSAKIVCDQNDSPLFIYNLYYSLCDIFRFHYQAHTITLVCSKVYRKVLSTHIEVYDLDTDECLFDFDIDLSELEIGYNYIECPDGPEETLRNYELVYTITYIGFSGEETHICSYFSRSY